jgi:hypothetical protein
MNDDILAQRIADGVNVLLKSANGDGEALYKAMVLAEQAASNRGIALTDQLILEYLPMVNGIELFSKKKK